MSLADGTSAPLPAREAKAFVPARDFARSRKFYETLGFALEWEAAGLACFRNGGASFLLQDFHVRECTENFQMHLLVEDVDAWWRKASIAAAAFGIDIEQPADRPWGMRDFPMLDPSGVLWRIGQPIA